MIKADVALGLMAWSQNWPIRLIIQTLPLPPWTPHPQPLSSRILKMNQELWPFQLLFQSSTAPVSRLVESFREQKKNTLSFGYCPRCPPPIRNFSLKKQCQHQQVHLRMNIAPDQNVLRI